jgi:hypothetical protein
LLVVEQVEHKELVEVELEDLEHPFQEEQN